MADNASAKGGTGVFPINVENFSKRLKVFYNNWKEHKSDLWKSSDAIAIATPPISDNLRDLKSSILDFWLLGYEFPETIIVFMHKQIHVVSSRKKANLIGTLKKAANSAVGADIVFHVKAKNCAGADLMDDIVQAVRSQSKSDKPVVGYIAREVPEGKLLETWTEKLSGSGLQLADVTNGFSELFAVKDTTEITFVKKAAYLTSSVLKNFVVPMLLKVIDEEEKVSHSTLMDDTEKTILDPLKVKVKLKPDDVDICYPPIFQSGGKFDLKPGASSNNEYLYCGSASVIICAIGSKYNSYCSNVARTYLIDATPTQSKAYETLLKAHEAAVNHVKPGNQMSAVYQAAAAVIERDAPELLANLTKSAGSGIGLEFQESVLYLNAENHRRIKQGMIFNVSLGLHNIQAETTISEKAKQFSLLLADTVLVTERGPEILTAPCSKAVKDVVYWFNKDAQKLEHMKQVMSMKANIRHVCIFAPGQPILKALLSDPRLLAPETMSDTTARGDEPMALYYRMDEGPENTFLVNVTNHPNVADLSLEFSAGLSSVDGALIGVHLDEGFTSKCKSLLQQALYEGVIPLLCIEVPDITTTVIDDDSYGEKVYHELLELMNKANDIVDRFDNKLLDDARFDPRKGNVCFCCSLFGWAFTLADLAHFWSRGLCMDSSLLLKRLWGDTFYDWGTKEWTSVHTGSKSCVRGFVHFCINFTMTIFKNCMKGNLSRLKALQAVKKEQQFVGKVGISLYKEVIQNFLPAGRAFLEMIISKLPSVGRAQQYRADHLYSGPLNDRYAKSIRSCNPNGPPIVYISKIIIDGDTNEKIAFGRIYSGTIKTGMKLNILDPGAEKGLVEVSPIVWIGHRKQEVESVSCGNVFGIRGMDQLACTLTHNKLTEVFPVRPISYYLMKGIQVEDVTLYPIAGLKRIIDARSFYVPYEVYNSLFSHQRICVEWFWGLHCNNGGGGILADDMGLGKTREVCAFLRGMLHSKLITRAIIVAPLSVVSNWKPELFKVGLPCQMFTQGQSQIHLNALEKVAKDGGILLTTYETVRIHVEKISKELGTVDYLFADEGHRLKNEESKATEALNAIKCDHRFIVTGTPIQNQLMGLYSLMKFCNPKLLGSEEDFKKEFLIPIDHGKYKSAPPKAIREGLESSKALHKLISPFILRRSKEILKDSGRIKANKYDVIVWVKISAQQANLYKALMSDPNPKLKEKGQALEINKVAKSICLDPRVVGMPTAKNISEQFARTLVKTIDTSTSEVTSSKLNFLLYFLPLLRKDKHKILVFSTSPEMLQLLKEALSPIINEKIIMMVGTTDCDDRDDLVEDFKRKDGPPIFLLTMKVGGMGINLTAASRVIIINPSDNPCDDNQAVDRAYRLGQESDVIVYRLISCSTVEERAYQRQILKLETSSDVVDGKPCERQISEQKGKVLVVPTQGFDVCHTHLQFVKMYGSKFESSLELSRELDLVVKHRCVYNVFNHNAVCSLSKNDAPGTRVMDSKTNEMLKYHNVVEGALKDKALDVKECVVKKKKKKKKPQLEESSQIEHDELQKGGI